MLVAVLRQRILELAVQGQLVPQRPEDGTAEELYQQIQQEKKKLIAAGKLKKQKPLPPITQEEIPFDIPESWKWVRLPDVVYGVGDKANQILAKEVKKEGAYPAVSQGQELIDGYTDKSEKVIRDLPLVMFGDHTRNVKFVDFPFVISADGTKFMKAICFEAEYLYYWVTFAALQLRNRGYARHYTQLKAKLVPLPPLAEQRRIMEKAHVLFAQLDAIEQSQERVAAIQAELNKRILERAIQGKLVPQLPEEGTAENLHQQIQREKKKLIAAGKLKKEKPLPPISEEEIPFDIPESWKWVHLDSIAQTALGKTLDKVKNTGEYHPYLCSINVYWSGIDLSKVKEARFEVDELPKYRLKKGDLLICEGGDAGRSAIWESDAEMYYQNALHRVRFYGGISPYFYKYLLEYYGAAGILKAHCKGQTIKHLVQKSLCSMWLPLPPLAEQQRIVKKIEKILTSCAR